ncbi:2-oxoacid:ferredoxin oxidoreductase subunit beta [bacterium]|nr:MAG: 2-oxoacid:ferredoxin oxidoreductase subunit beta [bacterium]
MSAPAVKTNKIGLTKEEYRGAVSTLCSGCGHDSITSHLITAFYDLGIEPHSVAKMSGIGCSSKTPAYFLSKSHGFNSVHGRMPSVTTGAKLANRDLTMIAVSGDGDTGNIGAGQFVHLIRRNLDMVYVIENNGVYGLTKGQFSATSDYGSKLKHGAVNLNEPLDPCVIAIELGCGYVVRSFAGDPKQLVPLLKGGIMHKGLALLDVISPCVTFNNHEGSTKSYPYVKEHDEKIFDYDFVPGSELGVVQPAEEIKADYSEGSTQEVTLHDGSRIRLKKIAREYDPTNKMEALQAIESARKEGIILTGLLYFNPDKKDLIETLNISKTPLYGMHVEDLAHSQDQLNKIMKDYR